MQANRKIVRQGILQTAKVHSQVVDSMFEDLNPKVSAFDEKKMASNR